MCEFRDEEHGLLPTLNNLTKGYNMRRLDKIVKQISEDPLFDNKEWFALQSDLNKITRWKHLEPILDKLPQEYMRRITSYLIKKWENELKSKGIKVINNKQNEKDTRI